MKLAKTRGVASVIAKLSEGIHRVVFTALKEAARLANAGGAEQHPTPKASLGVDRIGISSEAVLQVLTRRRNDCVK